MNDKLKIKYIIGSYKDNEDYPTVEDVIYLLDNYFTVNNTNLILHSKIENILKKDDINYLITELLNINYLEINNTNPIKYIKK